MWAQANMESLLEEDSTPSKSGASKRKLKKDRRLKRQEAEAEGQLHGGEVTWDEDQELSLLTEMGWSKCMGSTCTCAASASAPSESPAADDGSAPNGASVDAAVALHLDASAALGEPGAEAAEAVRLKLQMGEDEWVAWEQRKEAVMAERQRIREQLKQRFDEFCERHGVGIQAADTARKSAAVRWATAY